MNDREATKVIVLLSAAWPDTELPDPTLTLWMSTCADVDFAVAMEAAATLTRTNKWFPRLAEFLEAVNAVKRRDILEGQQVRALPAPPRSDQLLWKARMQALREMTARIGHGGGEVTHAESHVGCPGCAGLNARVDEILAEMHRGAA